jgi:ankyrin repeat protein
MLDRHCQRWLLLSLFAAVALAQAPVADAVMRGDKTALAALLEKKADVNAAQSDGATALLWAAHRGDAEMAGLLLRAGAHPEIANRYGFTPLLEAARIGSSAVVEELLSAGANPNTAVSSGQTALMLAARSGSLDAISALLNHGVDVNAREHIHGQTALMWAAAERHPEAVKLLIARGADVNAHADVPRNAKDQPKMGPTQGITLDGMTALHLAARQNDVDSARLLLASGARIDEPTTAGYTALELAVLNLHYHLAAFLLDQRADPNIGDSFGRTPLYAAIDLRNLEISSRPTPESGAIDHMDMIRILLAHGADPNARLTTNMPLRGVNNFDGRWADLTGATPYLRAVQSTDLPVMRLLLEHGANPKLQTADHSSALMLAAGVGFDEGTSHGSVEDVPEAIRICLEHGDDVSAANDDGYTALHGAAFRGANDVVRLLVRAGAKIDVKNKDGWSPETLALGHKFLNGGFNRHEATAALLRELTLSQAQ